MKDLVSLHGCWGNVHFIYLSVLLRYVRTIRWALDTLAWLFNRAGDLFQTVYAGQLARQFWSGRTRGLPIPWYRSILLTQGRGILMKWISFFEIFVLSYRLLKIAGEVLWKGAVSNIRRHPCCRSRSQPRIIWYERGRKASLRTRRRSCHS